MAGDEIFAADFKETPYWWEAAPRPERPSQNLPAQVDVAIVGAGFTGLVAALTLARSGRSVADLVRDAIRKVVLKPQATGPVAIWDGEPKRASMEHDSVHDEP